MRTITTQLVNCQDCHRCVRSCPVKAIGIEKGHAKVIDEKCIFCGRCVIECPQKAKVVENQIDSVKAAIQEGKKVVLSLAPSFVASFSEYSLEQLILRLRVLGFTAVEETSIGAQVVSQHYLDLLATSQTPIISACCPVVVNTISRYYPKIISFLANVVSPMMAHGRILKQKYGKDSFVVFAGPCIAKLKEQHGQPYVDAALTFEQLKSWLADIKARSIFNDSPMGLDGLAYYRDRYFPIVGGIIKSFAEHDEMDIQVISVDGIDQCMELFEALQTGAIAPRFVEALACRGGCINGPANASLLSLAAKKVKVIEYCHLGAPQRFSYKESDFDFSRTHEVVPISEKNPTDYEISRILHMTGKYNPQDEKNCGACGYNSCRDKAIAVFQGIAEVEMCIPYMRAKAESFANIIVDHSLHALFVMDHQCQIQQYNPAAEAMFNRTMKLSVGMNLSKIVDCSNFYEVARTGRKIMGKRVEYLQLGLVTEQMIIPVPKHGLLIAIIKDISEHEKQIQAAEEIKTQTVQKATEIITKQMQVAQEIAGLLGETTAETKGALLELIGLLKDKEER